MRYSKGVMWLDDCRIPFVDESDIKSATPGSLNATGEFSLFGLKSGNELDKQGRFTPNLLVCDDMLNDGSITKQNPRKYKADTDIKETSLLGFGDIKDKIQQGDSGSSSRYYNLDKWFDKVIDEIQ